MSETVDDYCCRAREELNVNLLVDRGTDGRYVALEAPMPIPLSATGARTLCTRETALEAARDGFAILLGERRES